MNKIISSDNGTLTDISHIIGNFHSGTNVLPIVAAEDTWFIGQEAPFNHLYFKNSSVNSNSSDIEIKYWDGTIFRTAVDVVDETAVAAASMAQSGFVSWNPDRDESGWAWDNTDDMAGSSLATLKIYDRYWISLKFSNDLSASTALSWLGQKFSTDDELEGQFPFFAKTAAKTAFESGKTDWEEQHIIAAENIIKDLISRQIITHKGQILRRDELELASIQKVAEIIYNGFGSDYVDEKIDARKEYASQLKKGIFKVDRNRDGDLNASENRNRSGFLGR